MTSTKERQQRAAARARLAREMAERQAAARRRRQRQAALGAATALVLIVGGVAWGVAALSSNDEPEAPPAAGDVEPGAAGPDECVWLPDDAAANPYLQEVGTPPPGEPRSGVATMTITTNRGVIEVQMDTAQAPCTAASFTHLAENGFYDDTTCHRLVTDNIYVLQCGDPSGTGQGGPTYRYAEENLPVNETLPYPKGTMAMAKTAAPSSTGSQFFVVYEDTYLPPEYTVVGTVTEGLEIVEEIAADGAVNDADETVPDGDPSTEIVIETLRVTDPA